MVSKSSSVGIAIVRTVDRGYHDQEEVQESQVIQDQEFQDGEGFLKLKVYLCIMMKKKKMNGWCSPCAYQYYVAACTCSAS